MRSLAARVVAKIGIDAVWLATEPMDMRAGTDTALALGDHRRLDPRRGAGVSVRIARA